MLSTLNPNTNHYNHSTTRLHHRPVPVSKCQMARIVCGIPFKTKRGTKVARSLHQLLCLSFLLASGWCVHSVYYLSYLSLPAFVFFAAIVASILVCYCGAKARDASSLYVFHILSVTVTLCMGCFFLIVFVTFVGMDAQQYIGAGWKNWNLTLTPDQRKVACTDKLPVTDPDATNVQAGGHQTGPIPLGCDFYYNMREQQLMVLLFMSVVVAFVSCLTCTLAFQMYEVIAGPQEDPLMEPTMESAANRLGSLMSEEWKMDDVEAFGSKQVLPRPPDEYLLQ